MGHVWVLLQEGTRFRDRLHNLVTDHAARTRQSTQVPYWCQLFENFWANKQKTPRPTKPPTAFLPWLFLKSLYSWSFPAAEDHRWKCSFRAANSLWNISLQLPVCAHISQRFQKGCPCPSPLFLFPDCFLLTSVWLDSSFCLPFSVFPQVLCSVKGGSAEPAGENSVGVGSLQLIGHKHFLKRLLSSAFWVCFPWAFFHY